MLLIVGTDVIKPVVAITNPAAGVSQTGTITVSATATDNDKVASVQFYRDGIAQGAAVTVAPYQISLNTAALTTGSHNVYAIATDRMGNTQQSATITFPVADQHPPSVSITSPGNGATVAGSISITATASDDVGVTHVDYYVDGGYIGSGSGGSWTLSYNTKVLADGGHTLQAYAYDAAGNQSPVSTISITTANNIVRLGYGASHGSVALGSIPAGSLVFVAGYMPGGAPVSVGDDGGNSYTSLNSGVVSGDPADGIGGALWFYYAVTTAPMTTVTLSGGGNQINVVAVAYSKATSGNHNNSSIGDWGGWGGPRVSAAATREVFIAVTVAGYDGGSSSSPNPSVGVSGPFTKLAAQTDNNISWAEIALSDDITASGGTVTPSGNSNNAADVYGGVCSFMA